MKLSDEDRMMYAYQAFAFLILVGLIVGPLTLACLGYRGWFWWTADIVCLVIGTVGANSIMPPGMPPGD